MAHWLTAGKARRCCPIVMPLSDIDAEGEPASVGREGRVERVELSPPGLLLQAAVLVTVEGRDLRIARHAGAECFDFH